MRIRLFMIAIAFTTINFARAEVMTPAHVARIRTVTASSMAPDGSKVAYILSVPRKPMVDDDGPSWTELHVVGVDGKDRGYVTGEVNVADLTWSSDSKSITFLSKRGKDEHKSLYKISTEGGEAKKVLSFGNDITGYSLSPSGSSVAFLAMEPTPKAKTDLEKKGFSQIVVEEAVKQTSVYIGSLDEGAAAPKKLEAKGSASDVKWSPSGTKLAVALAPTSSVDDGFMKRRIHIFDAESMKHEAEIENVGKLGKLAWSPDGETLAFISAADLNDPHAGNLFVAPSKGGVPKDLSPSQAGHVADILWLNDQTIGFVFDEGVRTRLGRVDVKEGAPLMLPPEDRPIVTAVSSSKDGATYALLGESMTNPAEVYLASIESIEPQRLTNSNPWLKDVELGTQEVVTFKARDGLSLEGVLIKPKGLKDGEKVPFVLAVHGGPESHIRNGWLTNYANPGQLLAARGIAVFYPNYRGSTGRGVAFSKLGQGDPAGKEFDDLIDAVDHFVAAGLADTKKIGVTGGSYGGYATAWCSTKYSDRFAAGVMFVGISDKISKTGTTDIPEEEFHVHARKRPWDDFEGLLKHSPIYYVKGAKTPVIILHGKEDPRVFPGQSMELFRFLKVLNQAPVRLVLYPGEGHGNLRAASRLDYNLRMLQWFEHFLKGSGGEAPPYELDYEKLLGSSK